MPNPGTSPGATPPPVEVTVRLYGLTAGESEVEIAIDETSDLGRLLAVASPAEQGLVFARLRRHLITELADAFRALEAPLESTVSSR